MNENSAIKHERPLSNDQTLLGGKTSRGLEWLCGETLMLLRVYGTLLAFTYFSVAIAVGQPAIFQCSLRQHSTFIDDFSRVIADKMSSSQTVIPKETVNASVTLTSYLKATTRNLRRGNTSTVMNDSVKASGTGKDQEDSRKPNATFVPFEEWKLANVHEKSLNKERRVRPPRAVDQPDGDSIGDDMEIDIGFFSNVGLDQEKEENGEPEGTIYKHQFNFASLDCAATIVKTNSEASGASSILIENKDKYLLNPCSAKSQFIIVELCQDILVEEIAIANFEYFSSTFSKLRFSVSDQYPVVKNGWRTLGEFRANNSRSLQRFSIESPQIWARYLQIEVLGHHDDEYYCPISLLRVHGKTMMDEFKMENSKIHTSQGSFEKEALNREGTEDCVEEAVEQCDLWPSIKPDNLSQLPQFPEYLKTCRSKLEPLRFEEFLRNLNESICPPKSNKDLRNSMSTPPVGLISTEESIFKNIIKRLTSLESNTTLTVRYIEEQGKLLSNSFEQLEKTQTMKFENLIAMFNETILENLNVLRIFANQLKDQSIKILEEQKLNTDLFTTKNMSRLEGLEKELMVQKILNYTVLSSILFTIIYFFFIKGEPYFDELLARDASHSASPITPKRGDGKGSLLASPVSPSSFSESD